MMLSSIGRRRLASAIVAMVGMVSIIRLQGPEILLQYDHWHEAGSWLSSAETDARNAGLLQAVGMRQAAYDLMRRSLLEEQYNPRALTVYRNGQVGADFKNEARYAELVARLGWRDENVNKAVLQHAVEVGNYEAAMERASALLTQRELSTDVMSLLVAFEQDRDGHVVLWRELARGPVWIYDFLQSGNLTDRATRDARAKTILWLLKRGIGLERRGLSPAIFAFIEAGQADRALALWRAYAGEPEGGGLYDTDFAGLLRRPVAPGSSPLPFEWNLTQAPGHSASMPTPGEGGEGLRIEWDGRDTPLFAWQQIRLGNGTSVRIDIKEEQGSTRVGSKLRFELACPPAQGVAFPPLSRGMAVLARAQISCRFPVLRVMGSNQGVPQPIDGTLIEVSVKTY